jgi:hypothetical protein
VKGQLAMIKTLKLLIPLAAAALLLSAPAFAQDQNHQGQGRAIVTVLPKHGNETPSISQQDLKLSVDGKQSNVTNWVSLQGPNDPLELVLLIDNSARASLGRQFDEIAHFIQGLPPNTKSTIAYMDYGRALFSGPLTTDHAQVLRGLHLPGGFAGSSSSPYFCLSDLAKKWPSKDRTARREVVMITDGIDDYSPGYDPSDPYVQAAIGDSVRAGLVVYSIYWHSPGFESRISHGAGPNLLSQVSQATGGNSYWVGSGNPVSFEPYFKNLALRLQSQYQLSFDAKLKGKPEIDNLKLKIHAPETQIDVPQQVLVGPADSAVD